VLVRVAVEEAFLPVQVVQEALMPVQVQAVHETLSENAISEMSFLYSRRATTRHISSTYLQKHSNISDKYAETALNLFHAIIMVILSG
jgi:hypothetical protein